MVNFTTVSYHQTGTSQNLDDMGMREMQKRAYAARNAQYLLIKSPPASGKSRALMFLGLDKLHHQGLEKVIIAVPERSIGKSFASTDLTTKGFFANWELNPKWDLTDATSNNAKTKALQQFLASEDQILLCTHATLRFAFNEIGVDGFDDCLIAIDEFHHVSSQQQSRLGDVVHQLIERDNAHIIAMTGSYFRGDTESILSPEDEERFARVTYTYYEQLNGYHYLKTLGMGYHFYRGRYLDAIGEVLNLNLKTIIHIPHTNSAESTDNKYEEVDRICDIIGKYQGVDEETGFYLITAPNGKTLKIANLVDDDPNKREKVIASLRNIDGRDDVDIIIAMAMAKEGFDWIWCEHALTVGYRGSLTEVIQIIGRATRDAPGKNHAQFTNLIAQPDASDDRVQESVNNFLKAIACSLLMEQVLAPSYSFKNRTDSDSIEGFIQNSPDGGSILSIKGLAPYPSERAKEICENDLNDLVAITLQDSIVLKAGMNIKEYPPEILMQSVLPGIIREKYPNCNEEEVEAISQRLATKMVISSPSVEMEPELSPEEEQEIKQKYPQAIAKRDQFIRMANKLIHVSELDIDLIETINPFQRAYEILSKTLNAKTLNTLHTYIISSKISMTEGEAIALWPKIEIFHNEHQKEPNINSNHPMEQRLAEALAWLKEAQRKRSITPEN